MSIPGRWRRAGITVLLAYALALQAVLFAFGGTLHLRAEGSPPGFICTQGAAGGAPRDPAPAHDGLCCVLSCTVSAAPVGPVPVFAAMAQRVPVPVHAGPIPDAPLLRLSSRVLPVGSRAPPRFG